MFDYEPGDNADLEIFKGPAKIKITKAEMKQTKTNKQMLVLTIKATSSTGKVNILNDYIVEPSPEYPVPIGLMYLCKTIGLTKEYKDKKITTGILTGKEGHALIKIDNYKKEDGSNAQSNKIERYISSEQYDQALNEQKNEPAKPKITGINQVAEDDFPF